MLGFEITVASRVRQVVKVLNTGKFNGLKKLGGKNMVAYDRELFNTMSH